MSAPAKALAWCLAVALAGAAGACSLDNQEGPLVGCPELECGRTNACAQGIIAQCVDGRTVKYHVCSTDDICDADWQVPGQYRCTVEDTDCEGCRPERLGCDNLPPLGGGGAGGAGAGGEPAQGGGGAPSFTGGGGQGGSGVGGSGVGGSGGT